MIANGRRRWAAAALAAAGSALLTGTASASELSVRAPDACAEASEIREQVDGLLGRPLAAVEGVDFDVEIARVPDRARWRLRVDAIDRDPNAARGGKRTRELWGQSCAELADAAAVAITMSIRASAPPATVGSASPSSPSSPPQPPAPALAAGAPAGVAAPSPWRLHGAVGLAVVADAGALPSIGPGAALEGSLDLPVVRLMALGALFAPRDTRARAAAAGSFQLALGALMACAPRELGRVTLLACLGGEIGRLAGEGQGVDMPRLGTSLWIAVRPEVGVTIPVAARMSVALRGGAAIPLAPPRFVVDGTTEVHKPSAVAGRGTLALQLEF